MKIKDLLGEDDFGKIAAVMGDKATIEKPDGTKMDVATKTIMPNPNNPGSATIDPSAVQGGLKPGMDVDTATQEGSGEQPYFVKLLGNQRAAVKSGNGLTPIHIAKTWDVLTPEIEEKARKQGFRKIMLSVNGALIPALEGGGKVFVGTTDYGTIISSQNEDANDEVGGDPTDDFIDDVVDQTYGITENNDDELLNRMRSIAGINSNTDKKTYGAELDSVLTIAGLR